MPTTIMKEQQQQQVPANCTAVWEFVLLGQLPVHPLLVTADSNPVNQAIWNGTQNKNKTCAALLCNNLYCYLVNKWFVSYPDAWWCYSCYQNNKKQQEELRLLDVW
jgi:hypothetical protein